MTFFAVRLELFQLVQERLVGGTVKFVHVDCQPVDPTEAFTLMQVLVIALKEMVIFMGTFPSFLYRKIAVVLVCEAVPTSEMDALIMVIVVLDELK